ncbi:MAG: ABC transporter permease [Oscillospiraceae bacterium]|nr:ABC transporter permease [Oscillospiraceae bacterium]
MISFTIKRFFGAVLTLFIVCTLTFFLMNIVPGGPFLSEKTSQQTLDRMNEKYGLDLPIHEQYINYMNRLLHGDLGISYKRQGFTVNEIIAEKFPVSAKLGIIAVIWSIFSGVILGTAAAMNRNKLLDRAIMFISTIGISVPGFILGTLLIYLFAEMLGWVSATDALGSPKQYILPVITLSMQSMSYIARLIRSTILDVIDSDFIKTAKAKGVSRIRIIYKHIMRNALIPLVTYVGPMTAFIITGGFYVERIFNIPGLGDYFVRSVETRDYPLIMGLTIFLALLVIVVNFIVDILYRVVDPRIKLQ